MKRFSLYLYLFTVILNMDLNLGQNLHAVWEVCACRESVLTFHHKMTVVTSGDAPLKRKLNSTLKISSRKKRKKDVSSLVDLPWRKVSRSNVAGFEGNDGMLELEEVEGVEIVYEETANGRIAKFRVFEEEGRSTVEEVGAEGGEEEKDSEEQSEDEQEDELEKKLELEGMLI